MTGVRRTQLDFPPNPHLFPAPCPLRLVADGTAVPPVSSSGVTASVQGRAQPRKARFSHTEGTSPPACLQIG